MSYLSLHSARIDCWGRADALVYLSRQIFDKPRSATLVYGDSGIGKTRLLRELQKRITAPGVSVGYYECHRGAAADPLLLCIDAFLDHGEWTFEGVQEKIRLAFHALSKNLKDAERLKAFCASLGSAALQSPLLPGLGKIAATITKTVSAVADIASTQAIIPASVLPKLPPVVFRDMLEVLHAAFPERRFVFLIDNASADAEALATGRGTVRTLDSFMSYLATEFARTNYIHFVLSWKDVPETAGALAEFAQQVREYGGDLHELGPLSKDSVSAWLDREFSWFRELSPADRDQCGQLCHGLPLVIARWVEEKIERYDVPLLRDLAADVMQRRYAAFASDISKSPQRNALYQLALIEPVLPVTSLAALWKQTPQEVYDFLETWRQKHLFRRTAAGFEFSHEVRQIVTREAIAGALYDGGRGLARELFEFFLSHAGYATDEHPLAPHYLDLALSLRQAVTLSEVEGLALEQVALLRGGGSPDLSRIGSILCLPWGARAALLTSSVGLAVPEGALQKLESSVVSDREARTSFTGQFVAALALVVSCRANTKDNDEQLDELFALSMENLAEWPDRLDVAVITVAGLVSALSWYGEQGDTDRIRSVLPVLEGLPARFDGHAPLANVVAHCLSNAVIHLSRSNPPIAEIDRLLEGLRRLAWEYDEEGSFAMLLAKAVSSSIKLDPQRAEAALEELRVLHTAFPDEEEIASARVAAISGTLGVYADSGRTDDAMSLAEELRAMTHDTALSDEVCLIFSSGLFNLFLAYQRAKKLDQASAVLAEIQQLYERRHAVDIAQVVAQGLVNLIGVAADAGYLKAVDFHLRSLREIAKQTNEAPPVRLELAKGLINAVNAYADSRPSKKLHDLLEDLYSILDSNAVPIAIRLHATRTFGQVMIGYGRARRWSAVEEIEGRALQILRADDVELSRFLVNASFVYAEGGQTTQLDAVLERIWHLLNTAPTDAAIAAACAKAFANGARAYRNGSQADRLSQLSGRLCALVRAYGGEDDGAEAAATGLKDCAEVLLEKRDFKHAFEAVDGARDLYGKRSNNVRLAVPLSKCLRTAVLFSAADNEFAAVDGLLRELESLHRGHPETLALAQDFGMGLSLAVAGLHNIGRDTEPYTSKLFEVTKNPEVSSYLRELGFVVIDDGSA